MYPLRGYIIYIGYFYFLFFINNKFFGIYICQGIPMANIYTQKYLQYHITVLSSSKVSLLVSGSRFAVDPSAIR